MIRARSVLASCLAAALLACSAADHRAASADAPPPARSARRWVGAGELAAPVFVAPPDGSAGDGACGAEPAPLPKCPDGTHPEELARAVTELGAADGAARPTTLRGPLELVSTACTRKHCDHACCNACSAALGVRAGDATVAIRVSDGSLRCLGCESRLCCSAPRAGDVAATGTLRREAEGRYRLDDARLCDAAP